MLIVFPRASPYAQGKLLAIAGPGVVFGALIVLAGARGRLARPALALGGVLALAIFVSDGFAYAHDRVAPTPRIEAIRQVGKRFAGQGLVLWNEFEEYAKYFARRSQDQRAVRGDHAAAGAAAHTRTYFYGHYFDLDEELLSFVEQLPDHRHAALARGQPPARQLPPRLREQVLPRLAANVRARQVLRHLPEQQLYAPSATVTCPALASIVGGAPAGTELVRRDAAGNGVVRPALRRAPLRWLGARPRAGRRRHDGDRRPGRRHARRSRRRALRRVGAGRLPAQGLRAGRRAHRRLGGRVEHAGSVAAGGLAAPRAWQPSRRRVRGRRASAPRPGGMAARGRSARSARSPCCARLRRACASSRSPTGARCAVRRPTGWS